MLTSFVRELQEACVQTDLGKSLARIRSIPFHSGGSVEQHSGIIATSKAYQATAPVPRGCRKNVTLKTSAFKGMTNPRKQPCSRTGPRGLAHELVGG